MELVEYVELIHFNYFQHFSCSMNEDSLYTCLQDLAPPPDHISSHLPHKLLLHAASSTNSHHNLSRKHSNIMTDKHIAHLKRSDFERPRPRSAND